MGEADEGGETAGRAQRKTYPRLAGHLVWILDEAEPFGMEHRLDTGEDTN